MNDDLDRLLERANELENDEELESPSENINEEVVSKSDDDTSYFGGEFHERDKLSVNNIVDEVKTSFLDYSMSVIKARALPDLRDGLKPVHRRILWSMYECGYTPDKPHKKCATTVGYVIGHYHPHGDTSVYDAMVRLAQDFNQRYTLVDGHGNFGNIEGDSAAAYRYTESRLAKISLELLRDINKNTVDMEDNFDVTKKEPKVLPSRFPNILVNGSMGIAVGMATNIPPHNLGEVIDGCIAYIDNPDIDTMGLMQYIKGPDFPTGGVILGNSGIKQAYETGRGTITIRSRATIEEIKGHPTIVITEVPYGVNTMELKNKVAELVHNKIIDGITDYHTDLKDGVKITITLKKDANAQVVLNNLYKHTQFQINYGIIFLMLDGLTPKTLPLKSIISKYIDHQKEVIYRRTKFDLAKSENRVHILEGYKIALDNIDEVVNIIRNAGDDDEARTKLINRFGLSVVQADSILELKLKRLTGLERNKIEEELSTLLKLIDELRSILANENKVLDIIKREMLEIKNKYSDDRRTSIDMTAIDYIEDESLIPEQDVIVTISNKNYIKRMSTDNYKTQNRGGVGIKGMSTNDEDFVEQMINLSTHDYLLFFTNKGKVYRLKGYEIPEFSRISKGLPIINLIQIEKGENVSAVVKVKRKNVYKYFIFGTKDGVIKRTLISEFDNIRQSGKIAITLRDGDELNSVKKSTGEDFVLMCSSNGRMVRFNENEVRVMGRSAAGVRGITLENDYCVGTEVASESQEVLVVTEKGYGKKTAVSEYRQTKRGSKGVKTLSITEKNGIIVGFKSVYNDCDLMIITNSGIIIRLDMLSISTMGRVTQGVRLINLKENSSVSSISVVSKSEEENLETENDEK
ncbi:dNA gyrase subunit A [Clostridium sp. CAG:628]|nr:dNA gyrase subunit A [Clostridium sp. CAG:628]